MSIGGDFNVTLEAKDRPNDMGGQDPDSVFWAFIAAAALIEIGPVDCMYTWRSMTGRNMRSRPDRFLCLVELAEQFTLADVRSLLRPLSDHTTLVWAGNEGIGKPTYFKMDRSWLREVGFKEEVEKAWKAKSSCIFQTERLANRIQEDSS